MRIPSIFTEPSEDLRPIWIGVYALVLGSVVFLLEVLYWTRYIRPEYFPAGDEFSLIVHSTHFFHPSIAEWLHRGFSKYFLPYPDISIAYTNFLRPVDNAVYYLESFMFFDTGASISSEATSSSLLLSQLRTTSLGAC